MINDFDNQIMPQCPEMSYSNVVTCPSLMAVGTSFILSPHEKLFLADDKEKRIWLIQHGIFTISRLNDGIALISGSDPFIVGLAGVDNLVIKAETKCTGYSVSAAQFFERANSNNLWKDISNILIYTIQCLSYRDAFLITGSNYTRIRGMLLHLMTMPLEFRMGITAEEYIRQRANISRSDTYRILSLLHKKCHVVLKRGRLLSVDYLPDKL